MSLIYLRQDIYNSGEYVVGMGEMEDLFILLTSPVMSCLQTFISISQKLNRFNSL